MATLGIPVPRTLVTQDPASIGAFRLEVGRVIYRPVTNGMFVAEVQDADLAPERLDSLAVAPVTFLELVPGVDVRVFVCDGTVLGAVCVSSSREVDFRGYETGCSPFHPSPSVAQAALEVCRKIGLRFSGLDFRIADDGSFALLECNNCPMFATMEDCIGRAVSSGLAEALAAEAVRGRPGETAAARR
jgi:glutathione synthase/RimK-type ligase-like ATP-grasp enzyme